MAEGGEDDLSSELSKLSIKDRDEKGRQQNPTKMALLNVHSINEKESKIKDLITKNKLSVFCLTETFTNENAADERFNKVLPENFTAHHWSRHGQGGGVAILCSKDLKAEQILEKVKSPVTSFEYVAVEIELKGNDLNGKTVPVITVYRPPKNHLKTFFDEFKILLFEVSSYSSIIVTGDFNIRMDKDNKSTRDFNALLEPYKLKQHVGKPTHNKGHILDLVITRGVKITRPRKDVRHDIPETDHYTVYFNAKPYVQPNDPKGRKK